jgi:hypothetical protein
LLGNKKARNSEDKTHEEQEDKKHQTEGDEYYITYKIKREKKLPGYNALVC